jgi:ParB family chromosome partitioning protein
MDAREHDLKCWPEPFTALLAGNKTFEYRKNDRGFQVGDILHLKEWEPERMEYTGREAHYVVTYILSGFRFEVPEGFCIMSVRRAT